MKKILILLVAVALVIWVISWFRAGDAVASSGAQPWPAGLGTLDSVAARYPSVQANGAAVKLTAIASPLPQGEAAGEYVRREIVRGTLAIGQPPSLPDVSAARPLLLHEPVIWKREGGIVEVGSAETSSFRAMTMTLARALVASALAKARENDPAAWEDLHAVWMLARSLEPQPQMMLQTASFSMARMINAVAWKLPLPAPAWLAEVQQRDHVRPLLAAFQYQAAAYWKDGAQLFPTKWLANSVEHDRNIAAQLLTVTSCDVHIPMNDLGTDLSFVWHRAFRYRAEREAALNALRIREGKPIEPGSRCAGGAWAFDGTTLRFDHEIAAGESDIAMPLALRMRP